MAIVASPIPGIEAQQIAPGPEVWVVLDVSCNLTFDLLDFPIKAGDVIFEGVMNSFMGNVEGTSYDFIQYSGYNIQGESCDILTLPTSVCVDQETRFNAGRE
ncbi:MAG: hypothetical protein C0399_06290 [Syntrophus sp. (in: bacteria)]|nr:hypothetical protein [Syntrophus sp. (in: bacteria)]